MSKEIPIRADGVSKRFCRSLKRSMLYGIQDIATDLMGRTGDPSELRRDEFWAVDDVSLELRRGECIGLVGHNGAGKTTLLKLLNGLIKPDRGRIDVQGRIGALIALGAGFNPILSGRENVYVNGTILGMDKKEIDAKFDEIVAFSEVGEFIEAPVRSYSSGMRVRLGFAVAAAIKPDILLLDEVLAVGDIAFRAKCFNTIANARRHGAAIILVSHNMHEIGRYADRVVYMKHGRIAFDGNTDEGIAQFVRDMEGASTDAENELTEWSEVYGSGGIAMTGARFRDGRNQIVDRIEPGEAVTLEVDFETRAEIDAVPVVDVLIRDREGVVFQATSPVDLFNGGDFPRTGSFQVTFDSFPVNAAFADFFITIIDEPTREVMDWKRHFRLHVGQKNQIGRVHMRPSWSLTCR